MIQRDGLQFAARIMAAVNQSFQFHTGYSGEYRRGYVSHRLDGGIRVVW